MLPDLVAEEERYQFQSDLELDSPAGDFETKLVSWKRFRKIILSGKLRLQLLRNQADDTGIILVSRPVPATDAVVMESGPFFVDVEKLCPTFPILYLQ